jgi:hypothetical protein
MQIIGSLRQCDAPNQTDPAPWVHEPKCPRLSAHNRGTVTSSNAGSERVTADLNIRCANRSKRYSSST